MNTYSDDTLLFRWRDHSDAHAFGELAHRHAPMVFATCRRILRNATEAEDLTQECFLLLAQYPEHPPECLPAWLHVIAVRRSLSRLRALGRRAKRERRFVEELSRTLETSRYAILGEVDEALAEMPESLRVPLVLHFLEQRGQDEIAVQLGVSQSTISRRLDKGIQELRARLQQERVIVSASALAACLQGEAAVMVPASLSAALGKISLAGGFAGVAATTSISATQIAALGGGIVMKKALVGIVVLAVFAWTLLWSLSDESTPPTQVTPTASDMETPKDDTRAAEGVKLTSAIAAPAPEVAKESERMTAPASEGGVILGRVLDAVTGEGIPGVVVSGRWDNKVADSAGGMGEVESLPSDTDGNYRISGLRGLAGARYAISRDTPPGYRRPTGRDRRHVIVDSRGEVNGVDFLLKREVPLSGTVVDRTHRPVAGATVQLDGTEEDFSASAVTNNSGVFSFQSLPPIGALELVATKDTALASEIYALSLTEAGITDLVLVGDAACKVSGTVVDTAGSPLAGYRVAYIRSPYGSLGSGGTEKTEADGHFEIEGLMAGAYELVASKSEFLNTGSDQKGLLIELEPGQQLEDVTLVHDGGSLAISGRVINSTGEPIKYASLSARNPLHSGKSVNTNPDGHFSIENLEEGDYDIEATWLLIEEKYQNILMRGIPAGTTDLVVVLPDAFLVTGRVLDAQTGQPIPEFEILLGVNWGDSLNSYLEMDFQKRFDPEGRFELRQADSHQSMLAARAPGYATAMKILDLTGPPYAHEVDLKLERGGALVGRVVDVHGAAVPEASIYWGKIEMVGDRATTLSAADGSFTLPSFPSDPQLVSAYHPSFAPASALIQGTARLRPVEIVLMEGGTIEGAVSFAEGTEAKVCQVIAVYNEGHQIPEMSVDVSPDGTFRIDRVQPGEVKVLLEVGADLNFFEQDRLSQNVSVHPGRIATVDFEVQAATGTLDGVLQYPQGALPSDVQVMIEFVSDRGTVSKSALVGQGGTFGFEGLPTGPASLTVSANFQNHRRIVTIVPVEVTEGDGPLVEVPL